MRKHLLSAVYIVIAFLITCLAIATGSYFNSGLIMEVGQPSELRVRAPRDVEDIAATRRNRENALVLAEGLDLMFTINAAEWPITENNLGERRSELVSIRHAYAFAAEHYETDVEVYEQEIQRIQAEYEQARAEWDAQMRALEHGEPWIPTPTRPELPTRPNWEERAETMFAMLFSPTETPITYSEEQQELIIYMEEEDFLQMWGVIEAVANVVQNTEMFTFVDDRILWIIDNVMNERDLPATSPEGRLAASILAFTLRPNAIPNVEDNERRFNEQANNYAMEWIVAGGIIVDENEIVTEEIYDTLMILGLLAAESLMDMLFPLLGVVFLVAMLFLASIMYLAFYRTSMASNTREKTLLFTLYLLNIVLVWTLSDFGFPYLPILVFPMLVSILINRRLATALTFVLVFICFFIVDGDFVYLFFYAASGMLFCMFSKYTTERGKSIWIGLLISAIMFVLSFSVIFISERNVPLEEFIPTLLMPSGFAAAAGILTVFLCMGSLPLWETFFGVVTPVKLLDLTNPTNLLLRRLTIEAPGTYHHSLIVANLAETAAYDIGANAHAARVGGYYHDVGKLKFPHYFVENIDGDNPHDLLDSINSSQIIMSHVAYGLTLAAEHRLPQFVRDIIKEHHGTTLLQYFFSKARDTGEECDEKDFRYPYTIPQSRESACVMLADSVEAAVRSMIPKISSVDEVEKTIRFIIRGKLNDGQLADSKLSIHDVTVIEQSFFRVLKGMYHERIAYPAPPAAAKT